MKIGYLSTIYHTSFILKSGKFSFESSDETNWKLFPTGPEMMKALESEDIDLGYIGLPPVIIGIEQGMKIKCVAGGHIEGTVVISNEPYSSYSELGDIASVLNQYNGKTIGTPTRGSIHDVIIRNLLKNRDISIKNYTWADFIPDAIQDGEIEAGVGTPSLATVASNQFNSKIVIPPNKIWPYNPSYGIVVQEELISNSPEYITSFLKAHEDASNLIQNVPNTAAEIAANEMGVVDKKFVRETYNISPRYCAKVPDEYIKSTMEFIPVLKELGYMNHDLKVGDIFNLRFIEETHKEDAHY
ncbi:ABC transporter substrate-binding protein [Methanobacterium spitsbergense]|uniref:ABC transporter substrate-binding protein n=1 Tax=Methanobacterium spitsbergense TaxID=2874285 RepID=A0A8T5UXF0_9EURY|nr:ABC transporter substrate-binding protein [Methanobacterium spitsbergense]MBZ2165369.1 ABC transporter substrate-binding protein [Methanobacterium spitsbergense]